VHCRRRLTEGRVLCVRWICRPSLQPHRRHFGVFFFFYFSLFLPTYLHPYTDPDSHGVRGPVHAQPVPVPRQGGIHLSNSHAQNRTQTPLPASLFDAPPFSQRTSFAISFFLFPLQDPELVMTKHLSQASASSQYPS